MPDLEPLNIRLSGADLEPGGPRWTGATEAQRRAYWAHVADYALSVKRAEIRRGVGIDGKKLKPVKPASRPDGAKGPPLIPHYAESRTANLLAAKSTASGVTLYWKGHGRKSWAKILGYHAYQHGPRALPVRNTIGISPAGRKRIAADGRDWWKRTHEPPRPVPAPPKPKPKPAGLPAIAPEKVGTTQGRVKYSPPSKGPRKASKFIHVYETGRVKYSPPSKPPRPAPAPPKPGPAPKPRPAPAPAPPKPKALPPPKQAPKPIPPLTPRVASPAPRPPVPPPVAPPTPRPVPAPKPVPQTLLEQSEAAAVALGIKVDPSGHALLARQLGTRIDDVPAAYSITTKTIYFNEQHPYWQSPQSLMGPATQRKWFSTPDDHHAIVHEIGHALHNRQVGDHNYLRVRAHRFSAADARVVKAEVSGYAATQPVEFVAEVFTALKSGRQFSPQVMALYRRYGGPTP